MTHGKEEEFELSNQSREIKPVQICYFTYDVMIHGNTHIQASNTYSLVPWAKMASMGDKMFLML